MQISPVFILLVLMVLAIGLPVISQKLSWPHLNIGARWARWVLFSALFAQFLEGAAWSMRPLWVHLLIGCGSWILLETIYNWIIIRALSQSPLPLFPSFRKNTDGDEWPAEKRYLYLKDWLRENDFKQIAVLKAELLTETFLRTSIYQSGDGLTRIHILFMPGRKNATNAFYTFNSLDKNGQRLITDNHHLPFGGYYPESWNHQRKPLIGSINRLHQFHKKRLKKFRLKPICFPEDAVEELNSQQKQLEHLNLQNGILVPLSRQEEEGKLTQEGCYHVWKEMWMLGYLGFVSSRTK